MCPCDHDMTPPLDQHFHARLLTEVVIVPMVQIVVKEVVDVMTGRRESVTVVTVIGGDDAT